MGIPSVIQTRVAYAAAGIGEGGGELHFIWTLSNSYVDPLKIQYANETYKNAKHAPLPPLLAWGARRRLRTRFSINKTGIQ